MKYGSMEFFDFSLQKSKDSSIYYSVTGVGFILPLSALRIRFSTN